MNYSNTQSLWISSTDKTDYPSLASDQKFDALVIGGGIAGITTAILLSEAGLSVGLIEANKICCGTTGHTTAKITSQHNIIYSNIINQMGFELAKQYAQANQLAIHQIKELIDKYNIDCDFINTNSYVYTNNYLNISIIEKEYNAVKRLDLPAEYIEKIDAPFDAISGVKFSNQGQFHPRKYILDLAKVLTSRGVPIFENTRALDISEERPTTVITNKGDITADNIVIASHFPFYDKGSFYYARMYAESSYIIGIENQGNNLNDMFISYDKPTRSIRSYFSPSQNLLLVGGESVKTGLNMDTTKYYSNLSQYAKKFIPYENISYKWSAEDYVTIDKVPYIGYITSNKKNIYVATGFGKWGMTSGTVAAMLIRDLIVYGHSDYSQVFSPSRHLNINSTKELLIQGAQSAYELLKGKLLHHREYINNIKRDECKIIKINNNNIGIYKNESGEIFAVDITCPHLKCELIWNKAEKTWDCPCHGSRYTYTGEVFDGPSSINLKKYEVKI